MIPSVSVSKVRSAVSVEVGAIAQVVSKLALLLGAMISVPNISIIFSESTEDSASPFWFRNTAVRTLIC